MFPSWCFHPFETFLCYLTVKWPVTFGLFVPCAQQVRKHLNFFAYWPVSLLHLHTILLPVLFNPLTFSARNRALSGQYSYPLSSILGISGEKELCVICFQTGIRCKNSIWISALAHFGSIPNLYHCNLARMCTTRPGLILLFFWKVKPERPHIMISITNMETTCPNQMFVMDTMA